MIKKIKILIKAILMNIFVLLFLTPSFTIAGKTIVWDQNDDAVYYVLYWGNSSGVYTDTLNIDSEIDVREVPLVTSEDEIIYYYALKAFNIYGNSSEFSEEIISTHIPSAKFIAEIRGESWGISKNSEGGCFIESAIK